MTLAKAKRPVKEIAESLADFIGINPNLGREETVKRYIEALKLFGDQEWNAAMEKCAEIVDNHESGKQLCAEGVSGRIESLRREVKWMSDILIDNEMDWLREQVTKLKADNTALKAELETLKSTTPRGLYESLARYKALAEKMKEFAEHSNACIRSFFEAGEPTVSGGYRTKFKGKWYQSTPINQEPKCECGLDEALALYDAGGKIDLGK